MRVRDYTAEEIERIADEENLKYDKERLEILKPIDAYDYAERILNLDFDWKYITPNCSCDGITFFTNATLWVWPCYFNPDREPLPSKEELLNIYTPIEINVAANTIIIDQSLIDRSLHAKERFSVLHECGHYKLHPKGFDKAMMQITDDYKPYEYGCMRKMNSRQKAEAQANSFAAAMLMPREIIKKTFKRMMDIEDNSCFPIAYTYKAQQVLREMAEICGASMLAMEYRLNYLKLLQSKG